MKKLILAFLITATAFTVNAQKNKNVKFSLGAELGVPTGNLNTLYSVAVGATAQADIKIDKDAALTFNTGVIQYVGKKIRNTNFKKYIPNVYQTHHHRHCILYILQEDLVSHQIYTLHQEYK